MTSAIGLVAVAVWLSPWLAFCAFFVLPLTSVPVILLARQMRAKSTTIRQTGYVFFDIIFQILSGMLVTPDGNTVPVTGRVRGNEVTIKAGDRELRGTAGDKDLVVR